MTVSDIERFVKNCFILHDNGAPPRTFYLRGGLETLPSKVLITLLIRSNIREIENM